jgi:hypothetical protein
VSPPCPPNSRESRPSHAGPRSRNGPQTHMVDGASGRASLKVVAVVVAWEADALPTLLELEATAISTSAAAERSTTTPQHSHE